MSAFNSLSVVLAVSDATACQLELERQRPVLEQGWAEVPGLVSACLALLPVGPDPERVPASLLLECSFETEFAELMSASFHSLGRALSAVLAHCAGYPESVDAGAFAAYLGVRARRSSAFATESRPRDGLELNRALRRVLDALAPPPVLALNLSDAELESRRSAVAMQEPEPGVPLVHVSWLLPGSLARVKRALRELEREPSLVEHDARFLNDGARLVFFAYPSESAQRWSEKLSQVALAACARVWRNTRGFPALCAGPRRRRERRVQEFVLDQRVPVAAWFNARSSAGHSLGKS